MGHRFDVVDLAPGPNCISRQAPVPFLVGLHSRYLRETSTERRPQGVVFVDLDDDRVYLGIDEDL